MSLFDAIILKDAPIRQGRPISLHGGSKYSHNKFWNPRNKMGIEFSVLNNININESLVIKQQRTQLQLFENKMLDKNQTFKDLFSKIEQMGSINSGLFNKEIQEAISIIPQRVRDLYQSGGVGKSYNKNSAAVLQSLNNSIAQFTNAINMLKSRNGYYKGYELEQAKSAFYQLQNTLMTTGTGDLGNVFRAQGANLEEIGIDMLYSMLPQIKKINPNVKPFNMGSVLVQGQMPSVDIGLFDITKMVELEYTIGSNESGVFRGTLEDFFTLVDQMKTQQKYVNIQSSVEAFNAARVLGIQAKSGFNTKLWNSERLNTQVSLSNLANNGSDVSWVLKRLWTMYDMWENLYLKKNITSNYGVKYQVKKQPGKELGLIVDYALANSLNKIMHLGQHENAFILTPNGFERYSNRLYAQYFQFNKYLHISAHDFFSETGRNKARKVMVAN